MNPCGFCTCHLQESSPEWTKDNCHHLLHGIQHYHNLIYNLSPIMLKVQIFHRSAILLPLSRHPTTWQTHSAWQPFSWGNVPSIIFVWISVVSNWCEAVQWSAYCNQDISSLEIVSFPPAPVIYQSSTSPHKKISMHQPPLGK